MLVTTVLMIVCGVGSIAAGLVALRLDARRREEFVARALSKPSARRYVVEIEYSDGTRQTLAECPAPRGSRRRAAVERAVRALETA